MEQLFFTFLNTPLSTASKVFKNLYLYLKGDELAVETLPVFPASDGGDSSLLNFHKIPEVSE